MNNIRFALLLVATVFFHQGLFAQQRVVSGTVRDLGGVLSGATIHEKGVAKNSTASDADGRFQMVLTGSRTTPVVRLLGFQTESRESPARNITTWRCYTPTNN